MSGTVGSENRRFRLADLMLDTGQRRVWRDDAEIELPKLSYDLLAALIEAAPNSLSTDELMEQVWAGAVVSPATIAKRVELLRQSLGDDSENPRYVALVRGHGYRLIPEVVAAGAEESPGRRAGWMLAAVAAVAAAAVFVAAVLFIPDPRSPAPEQSIAVLPFVSMSTDPDDEIFADGLTEELSLALARSGELRVIGRTSSFYYKGRNEDLRVIGETLGVATLLEGAVRRSGDDLRVTVQLVNASDGFQLWAETFDREIGDILEIQREIASSLAGRLQSTPMGRGSSDRTVTSSSPEASALYLRAVRLSPYGVGLGLEEAQRLIEQVVELDPGFAPGWNRLAAIHGRRMFFRDPAYSLSREEGVRVALEAIDRALALDPNSGEAYANLGGFAWVFDGDAVKAAPLIEKAMALDPWNLDIVGFAAEYAKFIGRIDEALVLEELLVDRDPLCMPCRNRLGYSYLFTGRLDEAEREFRTLRATGRRGYLWELGMVSLLTGRPEQALESFQQIEVEGGLRAATVQGRAMALFDMGRVDEAADALEELVSLRSETYPLALAQTYAYIGQTDSAFEWLESSMPRETIELQTTYLIPLYDKLRDDARWQNLIERIGRSSEQVAGIPFELNTALNQR